MKIKASIDSAWGTWFAGLCDGEGSFTYQLVPAKKSVRPRFFICMQQDDELLAEIERTFGFGVGWKGTPKALHFRGLPYRPRATWNVHRVEHLLELVAFIEKHRLRSKKGREFLVWSQLVHEAAKPEPSARSMCDLALRLVAVSCRTTGNSVKAQTTLREWLTEAGNSK